MNQNQEKRKLIRFYLLIELRISNKLQYLFEICPKFMNEHLQPLRKLLQDLN